MVQGAGKFGCRVQTDRPQTPRFLRACKVGLRLRVQGVVEGACRAWGPAAVVQWGRWQQPPGPNSSPFEA